MQLTTQIFPFFEIPNSAVRFVVIALAIGFPIAMLRAWVYEFTPEGVVRTEDLSRHKQDRFSVLSGRFSTSSLSALCCWLLRCWSLGDSPFTGGPPSQS